MKTIKPLFFIALFFLSTNLRLQAQTVVFRAVEIDTIAAQVKNPNSPFYHPNLLKRYLAKDTTLNEDEFFFLYYGYATLDEYSGYSHGKDHEKLMALLKKKDEHSEKDIKKIIEYSENLLKETPFNLDLLNYLSYAYKKQGNKEVERYQLYYMYRGVMETILSTGDGMSLSTPFWVIRIDNEYSLLNWLDFESAGKQALIDQCDKLSVKKNDQGIEELYFNVSIPFMSLSKAFKKK